MPTQIELVINKIQTLLNLETCKDTNYERHKIPDELRKEFIKNQKGKCYLCNCQTTQPLIHHIKPDGESISENLVMLCPLCHRWVHWMLKKHLGYRASIDFWKHD